jgi:hypothetical protein
METKKFDAVQFMRQVRDKMSADMRGMSFEEQRAYIEQHASKVRRDLEARESEAELPAPRRQPSPPPPPR